MKKKIEVVDRSWIGKPEKCRTTWRASSCPRRARAWPIQLQNGLLPAAGARAQVQAPKKVNGGLSRLALCGRRWDLY